MGLAGIAIEALESQEVRQAVGEQGIRIFNSSPEQQQNNDDGGTIGWLWNAATQFLGLIGSEVFKLVGFTLTSLWGLFVSTAQFIYNFNWNITDKEIDTQINTRWAALSGMFGGALGNLVGYLGCGVLPGAVIFTFNEPLGVHVLENVTEELAEEFLANVANITRYTFQSGVQSLLLWQFKNTRNFIKSNAAFLQKVFGGNTEKLIKAWGAEGSKPWSFAKTVDSAVESIPNEAVKNFVEEFLEEAWEGCVEAGYVVANSIDSFIAAEKLKRTQVPVLGDERYVEIKPDRTIDDQRIVLAGSEELLKPVIVQTLTNYQLMENKDIGQWVGAPIDDYLRAKPQSLRLVIQFFSRKQPPYQSATGQSLVSATYAIPDIKRSKLDWQTIKTACGGVNGYMWGRYRCTGLLDNGRQMQVLGATPDEAEDRLKALLTLSTGTLLKKPTISEDRQEDNTGSYLKQPTRIYPAYFTIMNQYKVPGALGSGIPMSSGSYIRKEDRLLLWTDEEPFGYSERINELLKKPGADTST
ncbi:hypothetical protein NIES4075_44590 [Tolypothrix sp. NIES-4075]|uniref:hypothetical protein n=1 Tax=Tolypothrix sp. NIES-4075 TaxID=2005459 RepID=UPI000B5CF1F4|nr:hypothetical protein [Tolypothrix sp. NIES-4075]GAX43446.1 hypothetical protein NIES4075_44590 [Tolypothrix sp. NIES-4075]